jgi:hypothetical protein
MTLCVFRFSSFILFAAPFEFEVERGYMDGAPSAALRFRFGAHSSMWFRVEWERFFVKPSLVPQISRYSPFAFEFEFEA